MYNTVLVLHSHVQIKLLGFANPPTLYLCLLGKAIYHLCLSVRLWMRATGGILQLSARRVCTLALWSSSLLSILSHMTV